VLKGASCFEIVCFCRLQVFNTKNECSEKSKKVKDYSKRVEQNENEVIKRNGKALCILCTESVGVLFLRCSFKKKYVDIKVVFLTKTSVGLFRLKIAVLALWNT